DLDGERGGGHRWRHLPLRGRRVGARVRRGAHLAARGLRHQRRSHEAVPRQRAADGGQRRPGLSGQPSLELGRVTSRRPPFKYAALTRVWFSDTDAQGVVYYGRYLPYFDHARTEYHRHLGWTPIPGAEFVMRASQVEYHAPARFDDLIESFVRVSRIGTSSVTYQCA